MSTYSLLAVPKVETTSAKFRADLVARAIGAELNPSLMAAVMSFESGFNPKAKNAYSGATGLIQWMPSNFPVENLADLTAEQQLPYAINWFASKGLNKIESPSPTDYYLAVFLPAFMGYPKGTIVGVKGSTSLLRLDSGKSTGIQLGKMYEQNPAFDTEKKGYFTVGDIGRKIEALVEGARGRAPIPVPLPVVRPPRPSPTPTLPSASTAATSTRASPSRRQRPALSARIGSSRTVLRAAEPSALPPLERGSHGPAVVLLQRLLNATMAEGQESSVEMDGEYGAQTELWVALHQTDADLEPDGQCGPLTWDSFSRDEFWGIDRIGSQTIEDPYGDGVDIDTSAFASTVLAPAPPPSEAFELLKPAAGKTPAAKTQRSPK